jgi:hypothetical protein
MKLRMPLISLTVILIAVLAGQLFDLKYHSRQARETMLKLDLLTMREAIDK